MRFDSLTFFVFLFFVLGVYCALRQWRSRKIALVLASYLFYAAWHPPFVILIWISTLVDYGAALQMAKTQDGIKRRFWLVLSLCTNLGMLSFFKYGDFLLRNFVTAISYAGVEHQPPEFNLLLPVGISFYTFQTLSYSIDVYRRRINATHSLSDFALFVTFFPQLVAGPIVRASDFLPQLKSPKRVTLEAIGWGAVLITIGLFYKQVLSDAVFGPVADQVFAMEEAVSFQAAWSGVLAFTGQIFCDFAGYSIIAIGVARIFGFRLPDNFNAPYAALGFSDFWRRWHISLSTWLRDYLYISMGGNRRGSFVTHRNLLITMLLGGLWHGAAWTFVLWGAMHGVYLIIERILRATAPAFFASPAIFNKLIIALVTILLVVLSWVPFRAESFSQSIEMFRAMWGFGDGDGAVDGMAMLSAIGGCVVLIGVQWLYRGQESFSKTVASLPFWLLGSFLGLAWWTIATTPSADRAFIYFQF